MILYAVAVGEGYLRDRREEGIEVLGVERCSVLPTVEAARGLAERFVELTGRDIADTCLVEMTLVERRLGWDEARTFE